MNFDIQKIRSFFPVLSQTVNNKPLVYFDSGASAQKPVQVFESEKKLHLEYYGNIHRASHFMANKATSGFEAVRDKVHRFINSASRNEIIFTKGTTESINLVASSFGEKFIGPGDEIIVSEMEHHSNIVPWQLAATRKKAKIIKFPFNNAGELEVEKLSGLITSGTKLVAVTHVSNVLGTVNPVGEIIRIAHAAGVPVLIDGAQAIQHVKVDVQALDTDFYVFSAHKMYGPNGVGVLYGKQKWLDEMPPYQGGGEMIAEVSFEGTTFNVLPYKFEAGTPNITGVIAFGEAIDLISETGIQNISVWENQLMEYASGRLSEIPGITIYGNPKHKSGVISFNINNIHFYDLGILLDQMGVAVRTGHHCADTVMQHYGIEGTVRISFGMYNTKAEIDVFTGALKKAIQILS